MVLQLFPVKTGFWLFAVKFKYVDFVILSMAIFSKKDEKPKVPETKRLSEIVFQMLVENVPEEQVIINLQQLGLDESRAHQVLSKAKQEFEHAEPTEIKCPKCNSKTRGGTEWVDEDSNETLVETYCEHGHHEFVPN